MTDLSLNRDQYLEFEKIGLGAFSPLEGFMNEDAFIAVVDNMRLPDGAPFPLPVVLDISRADAERLRGRPQINLSFGGVEVGTLSPESLFTCDKEAVAQKVYGTTDPAHPGVAHFMNMGEWFVGGKIELKKRAVLNFSDDELTPVETKALFVERGWKSIVGFQTRNVPHRAHEHLQRIALDMVDGIFIQPLVGRKKRGDYTPDAILAGYRALIDGFYRKDCVLLGILSTSMRYAGPREAVFHAIVRRNYGCTHFIVGRDHAGVGNYYEKYAAHDLTRQFDGELGIEIMRLHGPYFCRICDGTVTEHTCPHSEDPMAISQISGSDMRAILLEGQRPDPNLMRPEIVEKLKNVPLFIENDE